MKCDEQKPVCQNCVNSRRKCYRGIRLNFTQYTLYDPKDSFLSSQSSPASTCGTQHRILDQSIAVSSLYSDGAKRYKAFKKFHKPEDLKEAKSLLLFELLPKLHYQPEHHLKESNLQENLSFTLDTLRSGCAQDAWEYPFNLTNQATFTIGGNLIRENHDIRNYLLNDQQASTSSSSVSDSNLISKQSSPEPQIVQHRAPSDSVLESELTLNPYNIEQFISVTLTQNSFWLLDLFNEISLWKTIVPNYCIKLLRAAEAPNTIKRSRLKLKYLFGCLLCCSNDTPFKKIVNIAKVQLDLWHEFQLKDVTVTSYPAFERLILSVVLILQAILLQALKPGFQYNERFEIVLANQGRMLHKIFARFERIHSPKIKRLCGAGLTSTAFHTIIILRYFLKVQLTKLTSGSFSYKRDHKLEDPLNLLIDYDSHPCDISDFFAISSFEAENIIHFTKENWMDRQDRTSDSDKLRHCIFKLISHDKVATTIPEVVKTPENPIKKSAILIPNEKYIAYNLLNSFFMSRYSSSMDTMVTAQMRLRSIFDLISTSMISQEEKSRWLLNFEWAIS